MHSKYTYLLLILFCIQVNAQQQYPKSWFENESSKNLVFGKLDTNDDSPPKDYDKLIGECDCKSYRKLPNGEWGKSVPLFWKWKYIMNGNAIQDEGWFGDEDNPSYFTSIRVYDVKKKHWYVSYFTPNLNFEPDTWTGRVKNGNIVLKGYISSPNGELLSQLTFSDISHEGFEWEGKILTDKDDLEGNSFWKISCKKRTNLH